MKQYRWLGLLLVMVMVLTGCRAASEPSFLLEIEVEGVDKGELFYAAYLGGKRCQIGDVPASRRLIFSRSSLFLKDDVSEFSLVLAPYDDLGEHDTRYIEPLRIPARYGESYRVILSGTSAGGYSLRLE